VPDDVSDLLTLLAGQALDDGRTVVAAQRLAALLPGSLRKLARRPAVPTARTMDLVARLAVAVEPRERAGATPRGAATS
jgi:hypothetical protein